MGGIQVSLPGKCFLFGEYAVLRGKPALLATFKPRFTLNAMKAEDKGESPFHPDSPAGLLWLQDRAFFEQWNLTFEDAYAQNGGFGRSSAEFGCLFLLRAQEQSSESIDLPQVAWQARTAYQELLHEEKTLPSGVDLVAQVLDLHKGSLVYVDTQDNLLQELSNLPRLMDLYLIPSGHKQPTHDHLRALKLDDDGLIDDLTKITTTIYRNLQRHVDTNLEEIERAAEFGESLNSYSTLLDNAGLLTPDSREHLQKIRRLPGVFGAKGCGALGADVYTVAVHRDEAQHFLTALKEHSFPKVHDFCQNRWLPTSAL